MMSSSTIHHKKSWHFLFLNAFNSLQFGGASILSLCAKSQSILRRLVAQRRERKKQKMAMNCKVSFGIFATFALVFAIFMPAVQGQDALGPAPAPTSDGTAIDQGIAYGLMLLALVLTYIIHTFDVTLSI